MIEKHPPMARPIDLRLSRPPARTHSDRLAPLINLAFLLLIMILMLGVQEPISHAVRLPSADAAPLSRSANHHMLALDTAGNWLLDDKPVSRDIVLQRVPALVSPDGRLMVAADAGINMARLQAALDGLAPLGVELISFVVVPAR